ncbi:MAG: HNH endonuclease [Bacteroidota bacterium]
MYKNGKSWVWEKEDEEYLNDNFLESTYKELKEHLPCSASVLKRKKEELGLPNKRNAEELIKYFTGASNIPGLLYSLHHEQKYTVEKMSEIVGVSRISINRIMDKYNIHYRNMSETMNLRYKSMNEEDIKKITKAAHEKTKEMAKKGIHPFQIAWKERPEEMLEQVKKNAAYAYKHRKKNGMKGVTGPDHPNWNPNLTPEERTKKRRKLQRIKWRERVYERDNYTCQVCGDDTGGNLNAHHLYNYMDYPSKRADIDNGITLCEDCHKEFHKQYGWGENTAEQFEDFMAVVCNG